MMRRGTPDDAPATLGRIDLVSGKAQSWCDAHFLEHAPSHDGAQWYVAERNAVACVDVQAQGLAVLWRVGQLPGRVLALARSPTQLSFAMAHDDQPVVEVWHYALSSSGQRLDRRTMIELPQGSEVAQASCRATINPAGAVVVTVETEPARLFSAALGGAVTEALRGGITTIVADVAEAIACVTDDTGCVLVRLPYESMTRSEPLLVLGASRGAQVHRHGDRRIVCDERGRVIELDDAGRIVHWLLVP